MKNLLNPKWIIIINTLPIVVLFFLYFSEFTIIKTLLNEESIKLWKIFGWSLASVGITNLIYAIYLILRKKKTSIFYGFIALPSYTLLIYLSFFYSEKIIPSSIPQWMIPENMVVYVSTFLMPTLIYSLFILVYYFTSNKKEYEIWKSFIMVILIPILWYLFSHLSFQFNRSLFGTHTTIIMVIIGTFLFLFFLIRSLYLLTIKKNIKWKKHNLAWKIPISIILPLLGLAVNRGFLLDQHRLSDLNVFGNFSNNWFYLLALINGILICIPDFKNKFYRLFLFFARSISFAFTLYFFLVFLPFLPLSVIAIIAFGLGFLMLTPLLLFVIHTNELSKDFNYLNAYFSKKILWVISIIGFLVIPFTITVNNIKDSAILTESLEYIYTPNYSKKYQIDASSLAKTLNTLKQHKSSFSGGFFWHQTPYLSTYFNWLVLNNLTLSNTKINRIENVFFGKSTTYIPSSESPSNKNVKITDIKTRSYYDEEKKAWVSWIDLEITNLTDSRLLSEYATTFSLPTGCWISDYYLYVENQKEMGILSEKKSAMWIFSQIKNTNKDPGILYYLIGDKVAFRVFPFNSNEVRKTGIEFIHKEPITITIDGHLIELGEENKYTNNTIETDNAIYIPVNQKEKLKQIKRKPYFHFIVDTSINVENKKILNKKINQVIGNHKELCENAKISYVNKYITTSDLETNWEDQLAVQKQEGGFYLDRAIKKTLIDSYQSTSNSYPVMVVVTDNFQNAIIEEDYSNYKIAFPESNTFFVLKNEGLLEPHSLISNPMYTLSLPVQYTFNDTVLYYESKDKTIYYIKNNKKPSIILKKGEFNHPVFKVSKKNWNSALTMQGMWLSQVLHPETTNKEGFKLVKNSFISNIMTPVTSFLVLENEAQKAMLKKKQEQVLSSNQSFDLSEDSLSMSEPSTTIMLVLLIFVFIYFERKKKRIKNIS